MSFIERVVEEKIRAAQDAGEFDNLRGKGQPLKLDQDPLSDPAWQLASHILKEGGFSLPWIEVGKEIEIDLAAARSRLRQAFALHQSSCQAGLSSARGEAGWQSALRVFCKEIETLNRRIFSYNLQVPALHFQRPLLHLTRELLQLKPDSSNHPDCNPAV